MDMVLEFSIVIDSGEVIFYILIYFDAVLMCLQQLCIETQQTPNPLGSPTERD